MIRCAVFDFDGTLVDSNQIKIDAFYKAAAEYEGASDHLTEILADPGTGGDRYAVCAKLAQRLAESGAAEGPTTGLSQRLAEHYGALCLEQVSACPEIAGARDSLAELKGLGLKLYINSTTPEAPLREILRRRDLIGFFDGVLGSSNSKAGNLELICSKEGISRDQIVMIGDLDVDCRASREVGCHFIGIAASDRAFSHRPNATLPDLTGLAACMRSLLAAGGAGRGSAEGGLGSRGTASGEPEVPESC